MKIDFHCHIFYEKSLDSIKFLKNLFEGFENYGFYQRIIKQVSSTNTIKTNNIIEKAIYHAKKANLNKIVLLPLSHNENKLVKDWTNYNNKLFIPFYNPPEKSTPENIKIAVENALLRDIYKGLKIMLPFRKKFLNESALYTAWEIAEKLEIPVLFHTGYPPPGTTKQVLKYANPINLEDIISSFTRLKIIIAHFGYPFTDIALSLAVQYKNVFLDISNLTYMMPNKLKNFLLDAKEIIGVEKILFGSDAFVCEMLETTINYFNQINFLSDNDIDKILGLNAIKLLSSKIYSNFL